MEDVEEEDFLDEFIAKFQLVTPYSTIKFTIVDYQK